MDYLGLDEKSFRRGQSYVTIGSDLDRGVVFEVAEGQNTEAAKAVIGALPPEQRDASPARSRITCADCSPTLPTLSPTLWLKVSTAKNQAIKHAARGFRSFAAYRIRILFYCGGLDMRPRFNNI